MSFNGSGSYSPPSSSFPAVTQTLIGSAKYNAVINDIATALTTCITKDGQTTITGNISWNGFKMVNLGSATARTDSTNLGNIQDGTGVYIDSIGGTANAITLFPNPAIANYTAGQCFHFVAASSNTGAVTIAMSGLTAKSLFLSTGTNLVAGDILAGQLISIIYTGTYFLLASRAQGTSNLAQTLTNSVLTSGTVTADPTTALGIASKQYVDALWTTGDVKLTFKTTADSGWVLMNDGSIGSSNSAATTRANDDTQALFTLLWTNIADADCPVSGGRGGSAAADFTANKTLTLSKVLGRALGVAGAGSGLTSRALGHVLGSEDAINVSHSHTVTDPGHTHTQNTDTELGTGAAGAFGLGAGTGSTGGTTASNTTGLTVDTAGSSGTGANMPPMTYMNVMIKL